ncbi:enoyl-CoA hydratase/isomerase family protein [Tessaracoccus sp. HDW20]|nr:enoyl-CoA hydratase/isomerase family protein [Tessaracoccus coleopterorum]
MAALPRDRVRAGHDDRQLPQARDHAHAWHHDGRGLGLGSHADRRIVYADTVMAMPETKIGFFPDVGVMHQLSRAGAIGRHLALTSATFTGGDALLLNLADESADGPCPRRCSSRPTRGSRSATPPTTPSRSSRHWSRIRTRRRARRVGTCGSVPLRSACGAPRPDPRREARPQRGARPGPPARRERPQRRRLR